MDTLLLKTLPFQRVLVEAFRMATVVAINEAWGRAAPQRPHEPDIVAMLVLKGTELVARALEHTVGRGGLQVEVASVFCHNRPMVEYGPKKNRCELGDVLIALRYTDGQSDTPWHNALLLQAKMANGEVTCLSQNDLVQLELYRNWPPFRYYRSGTPGVQRDVNPKARHMGAQYLLIDSRGPDTLTSGYYGAAGTYPMAAWPAQSCLVSQRPLQEELFNALVGLTGREFFAPKMPDPTGWSDVVWDLLRFALAHTFSRKRTGLKKVSRHAGAALSLAQLDGECFSSTAHSSSVRAHQDATQRLLKTLLPTGNLELDHPGLGNPEDGMSVIFIDIRND